MSNMRQRKLLYSPKELMMGGGLLKENGKANTALYNQWLYRRIFTAHQEADGPGTISMYSFENIVQVAIVVRLRNFYIPLKKAAKLAQEVMELLDKQSDPKKGVVHVTPVKTGGLCVEFTNNNPVQDVLCLNIRDIYIAVTDRLNQLGDHDDIGKYLPLEFCDD